MLFSATIIFLFYEALFLSQMLSPQHYYFLPCTLNLDDHNTFSSNIEKQETFYTQSNSIITFYPTLYSRTPPSHELNDKWFLSSQCVQLLMFIMLSLLCKNIQNSLIAILMCKIWFGGIQFLINST